MVCLYFNTQGIEIRVNLHDGVSRASPALGHCPVNVFLRHLDRAALAVDAVLCVDNLCVGGWRACRMGRFRTILAQNLERRNA